MEFSFFMTKLSKKSHNLLKKTHKLLYVHVHCIIVLRGSLCMLHNTVFSKVFLLRVSKPPSLAIRINARTTDNKHRKCYVLTHTSLL